MMHFSNRKEIGVFPLACGHGTDFGLLYTGQ